MKHYSIGPEIDSMDDLRALFPGGEGDSLNWLVLSTSGVHGHYGTLDDEPEIEDGEPVEQTITVLVIQPRVVYMRCGTIPYEPEDEPWLRHVVETTLAAITASQEGNRE